MAPVSSPEEVLDADRRAAAVERALGRISPRHQYVVRARMGFDGPPMTYKSIGAELGVCGQRARQMEHDALRRMRLQGGLWEYRA